jgi:Ca-activated chloride channel family protein
MAVLLMPQALRVEVALVTVGVRVTDQRGRVVKGLTIDDFSLYEEAARRDIAFFSNQELPISLCILLDRSNSMDVSGKLTRAKEAALALVGSSHPETELLYLPFDYAIPENRDFISDRGMITSMISGTEPGIGTCLYDAVIETLRRCADAPLPLQALVIVTDGADQHSKRSLDEVTQAVQESQAQVYMIGYFSRYEDQLFRSSGKTISRIDGLIIDNPRIVFKRLAEESGAEAFFPKSDKDLRRAVEKISADLRQQYTLAFYPPKDAAEGSYRRLRVKVNRSGVVVHARKGYRLSRRPN